jgi:hypothetical protein
LELLLFFSFFRHHQHLLLHPAPTISKAHIEVFL